MAILYALISGLLMAASWPDWGWSPLMFLAWVPLLMVEERILTDGKRYNNLRVFGLAYLTFLSWNICTTWWVMNASVGGALLANLANSLLMASVFTLFHTLRKRLPSARSAFYLPVVWLAFEYLHYDWDLSWPWLSLGNVFAGQYQLVQWYEFTGVSGGSLWILLVNVSFARLLSLRNQVTPPLNLLSQARKIILSILLPVLVSLFIYYNAADKGTPVNVAVIQPNVDPYLEKFDERTFDTQTDKFIQLAGKCVSDSTDWLIGPETAIAGSVNEAEVAYEDRIIRLDSLLNLYPRLNMLIGAETHRFYKPGMPHPAAARPLNYRPDVYFEAFNTALHLQKNSVKFYHKSKLVPGVEQMPFPAVFRFIEDWAIDLGGTTGSLGKQQERTVFRGYNPDHAAAPAICYESVFGDFIQDYVANGASFIAVITNDGWWGDTPGYKQHLAYARLRAIENRRSIVRSANTGISCLINQRGDISHATSWWTATAFSGTIRANKSRTFFSLTGDIIGLSAVWLSCWMILWMYWRRFKRRDKILTGADGRPLNPDELS
jgi:apolipoprotein N-acyltransferase